MSRKPLEGVRILDLTRVLAGPTASMILGDLGADVIKVENPGKGDETRQWGPPFQEGESAYYFCANRNKRSMALDLKQPLSRPILKKLTLISDVVMLNLPYRHIEKLNLSEAYFRSIKEDIIWANISGFGIKGSKKDEAGYDIMIQGLSGLMSITGEREGEPMKLGVAIADVLTALYTVIAVVSALFQRKDNQQGCAIDNSLLECTMASLVNVASSYLMNHQTPQRFGNEHPNIVPYQVFKAKDKYFILAVGNDQQWQKACQVLNQTELGQNPRFSTNQLRVAHRQELIPLLSAIFLQYQASDLLARFSSMGIPCGLVRSLPEAFKDPYLIERNFVHDLKHPTAGHITLLSNPIHFSHTDLDITRHPPLLGEHTREIMNFLGYSDEEVEELIFQKVIR
jgi:crotonobetainyl-CoA:carnitine CoA-transferase CaiB-like acyl-CoA transferase